MLQWRATALLLTCWIVAISPAAARDSTWLPVDWQSPHYIDHRLVGQVFDGSGDPTSPARVIQQAQQSRFVLLGEAHDNPDHHRVQAALVDILTSGSRRAALVFEQVPQRLAAEVAQYDLKSDPQLDDFGLRLEWESRGWYEWNIYRPIALAAANNGSRMIAGNLDQSLTRAISKSGLAALTSAQISAFGLETKLPQAAARDLNLELQDSHCGMMPKSALPAMTNVQRARDGSMAQAMIQAADPHGSILIAGTGHVRKDRGVPYVLHQLLHKGSTATAGVQAPRVDSLAVGLVEVDPDRQSFDAYDLQASDGSPLFDFVLFTPKFDITDHCRALREKFKKPKKSQP